VRPKRFELLTPWFVGSKSHASAFIYQYLTSVRYTQKQSKAATGTPLKLQSGTVLTTAQ